MAIVRLDPKNLNIDVVVGIEETYKPTEKIKSVYKDVEQLKKQTNKKLENICGKNRSNSELSKILKNEEKKQKQWKEYLEKVYTPKVKKIIDDIKQINEQLCPNFKEATK